MTQRAAGIGLCLVVALTGQGAGCGQSGLVGGRCAEGLEPCAGECVDLDSDAAHCGSCERACGAGETCESGLCEDRQGGGSGEGGAAAGGTGVGGDATGGSGGAGGSGGSGGSGGAGGSGGGGTGGSGGSGVCLPPFDRVEACGDCDTACAGSTPLCAPGGALGFECVPACDVAPYTTQCAGSCVNLDDDASHCGQCGRSCPSGICNAGACIGATSGHMVAMCMDFATPSTAQTTLLGNAVFLTAIEPARVLAYVERTPLATRTATEASLATAASQRGRTYALERTSDATAVAAQLNRTDHDVLLVYEQVGANAGTLGGIGTSWQSAAAAFAGDGGVVVVLTGTAGVAMSALIDNLGIFSAQSAVGHTGKRYTVASPGDALSVSVVSPFLGVSQSCTFSHTDTASGSLVFVTVGAEAPGTDEPGVVHRIVPPT